MRYFFPFEFSSSKLPRIWSPFGFQVLSGPPFFFASQKIFHKPGSSAWLHTYPSPHLHTHTHTHMISSMKRCHWKKVLLASGFCHWNGSPTPRISLRDRRESKRLNGFGFGPRPRPGNATELASFTLHGPMGWNSMIPCRPASLKWLRRARNPSQQDGTQDEFFDPGAWLSRWLADPALAMTEPAEASHSRCDLSSAERVSPWGYLRCSW